MKSRRGLNPSSKITTNKQLATNQNSTSQGCKSLPIEGISLTADVSCCVFLIWLRNKMMDIGVSSKPYLWVVF